MGSIISFLFRYGYVLLFGWVLAEQLGLPLPSAPMLLAAGALAGTSRMNLAIALLLPITAAVVSDAFWYELGRRRGVKLLSWLCRISLEPDSCVHKTQSHFERRGEWALVVAKFIPGLNSMAPPLAGASRMPWPRFAFFDGLGALLWVSVYIGVGYIFSGQIERAASRLVFLGRGLFALFVAGLLLYIGWKYFNRRRFLHSLRIARITPNELHQRMGSGENVVVVDLRHSMEFESEPETIPGAVHMDAADLEEAVEVIPRDREIVLFCSCPNEATAAQMALRLRNHGIIRIRPLAGGLAGWRDHGFPLQALKLNESSSDSLESFKPGGAQVPD
ncbi:MAG TPA: DedA family protein/thiosulfate sulfurtransferase GlpE [Candidatus Acidoferrales bacterium]|nr:DedA family protein/thiosulfate sulfurtransferase GlpE [Candidatus Acidoferrales bacterium]